MHLTRRAACVAGLLALAGCNSALNPNLPPGDFAGSWSGPLSSSQGATLGTLRLTLTPSLLPGSSGLGWTTGGRWWTVLVNGSDSGTVSGTGSTASTSLDLTLTSASGCSLSLSGLMLGGASMITGRYVASSCAAPDSGAFSLTKQ